MSVVDLGWITAQLTGRRGSADGAQQAALGLAFPELCVIDAATGLPARSAIDKVDRFQGGERTVMRKKFSAILHSHILDHPQATPERIRTRAKRFGITLQVRVVDGTKRLVFPDDTGEAAKLLQYLAEELYFSDLTEQPCETNSHRPLPLVQPPTPDV